EELRVVQLLLHARARADVPVLRRVLSDRSRAGLGRAARSDPAAHARGRARPRVRARHAVGSDRAPRRSDRGRAVRRVRALRLAAREAFADVKARAAAVCITEEIIDVALRMGLEWLADGRRPRSKPFRTEP